MKPASFDYLAASSLEEALEALHQAEGEAKLLAGGQSLTPLLSLRLATPSLLIDLNSITELAKPGPEVPGAGRESSVAFGALTRHRDLMAQTEHPLLAEAASWIGHAAIRSRGTIGGSLAHADPAAELPAVAVACDARITVASQTGTRVIEASDMFAGIFETALTETEMITEISLATPARWGFAELARRHGDFGLVLAVVTEFGGFWRVVIGGVASTPIRCRAAEAALNEGAPPGVVALAASNSVPSYDDLHATARYRRALAGQLTGRAAEAALTSMAGTV